MQRRGEQRGRDAIDARFQPRATVKLEAHVEKAQTDRCFAYLSQELI
jgi:hypothetical protein